MKKILSMVMVFFLFFGLTVASANPTTLQNQAGEHLRKLNIYQGYEDGSLRLDRNLSRTEFSVLAIRLLGLEHQEQSHQGKTNFKDVGPEFSWASGYINLATQHQLVQGRGNGIFDPSGNVTYAEAVTILVRLLGYDKDVPQTGSWETNYINQGNKLGITKNVNLNPNAAINRGDIAILIYNSLGVQMK